jgi:nitroreductase
MPISTSGGRMEIINNRRSIRKYQDRHVEENVIEAILRAGMQAPSGGNQQPWEFLVVKNKELLARISEMSPYSAMVAEAAFAIIVIGNMERCRFPELWQQDLGACTENILLEVVNQKLGAVWLAVAPMEDRMNHIKDLFNLSENIKPFNVIPVGYPDASQTNQFVDRYEENRIKIYS